MISKEQALSIINRLIAHFESTNIEGMSGIVASANYAELLDLRDLQEWVKEQRTPDFACTCAENDLVDLVMFCSHCGGKVPQSR